MAFVNDPRRDASPTIAGFVFQVNVTILRWLALRNGQHLELECGEDIDTIIAPSDSALSIETRMLEQLKVRSSKNLTLRSPEALEALSNFCMHRSSNPNSNLSFRFITTAVSGVEQGWGRSESGIETWTALRRGRYDDATRTEAIAAIRTLLRSCERPKKTSEGAWQAFQDVLATDDETQLSEIVLAFDWGIGYGDHSQTEDQIVASLTHTSLHLDIEQARHAYEHLFAFVFRLLCQAGQKLLNIHKLTAELQTPSSTQADRAILQMFRNELGQMSVRVDAMESAFATQATDISTLKQTVRAISNSLGFDSGFALSQVSLSTELPELVSPCAARNALVEELLAQAQAQQIVELVSEPGSGKTQLLVLAIRKTNRRSHWLNVPRHATEEQACMLIDALVHSVGLRSQNLRFPESYDIANEQFQDAILVIEDLPRAIPGGPLAIRIEALARRLKSVGAILLISSYFALPATTEQALGQIRFDVPRFTTADVAELLTGLGAPEKIRVEGTYQLLVSIAEGLPTLVMAAVRYLADREWKFTVKEIEGLFGGEYAAAHRRDATSLLQLTVPDPSERELLIRMSLAVGEFTMDDIAKVARVPRAIPLPGEKVGRATGLWLQRVGKDRYVRSPLITSGVADALDPETRKNVHFVLALRVLARKTLDQFEALLCIVHLINADAVPFAITVAIQALLALLEAPQPVEDDWGFSRMWPSGDALSSVDVDLQLTLRAVQIALLAKQGRDVLPMVQIADQLITRAGASSWGAAFVSSTLAIHLLRVQPILANKYLLGALNSFPRARLPNGLPLPASPHPLEDILWATAIACKSDADVDSWLTTISQLTPAQLQTIKKSQLAPDNVTVLCDGIWLRVYLKPEAERDWDPVETKIEEIEATARAIGFPLLEAAALRTRIMLLMEWRHRIEAGLQLSESSLIRFDSDDCRFLITEVTGRQLSYAGRPAEARGWLERALSCDAYRHSLWRRNVLITMAELESASTPNRAVEFTAAALKVSREGNLADPIYIDSLAEHGIALWNSGDRRGSFEMFEEATNRVLATKVDSDAWKGEFARLFGVIVYFSAVALNGEPQHGHYEPKQGLFLASNTHAHTAYKPEQLAYICIRLAMFADGIQDVSKSASWTWRAIEAAQNAPTASEAVGMQSWHAIPAALLSDDFVCAAKLVGVITEVDIDKVVGRANGARQIDTSAGMTTQGTISLPTSARKSLLHLSLIVPIGLRLGFLQFRGADIEVITGALKEIESIVPVELQVEAFTKEIARALLHDCDWQALWNDSCEAYRQHQYVRGCVLSIGSMKNAPLSQSLYMQVSIAQNMAGFFNRCASIYREIVAPFFVAYWQRAVNESSATFRTAATFTQRQLKEADGSPEGTRRLLKAMRFCLGVKLPEDAMRWLDS